MNPERVDGNMIMHILLYMYSYVDVYVIQRRQPNELHQPKRLPSTRNVEQPMLAKLFETQNPESLGPHCP